MRELIVAIEVLNHGETPEIVWIKRGGTPLLQMGVSPHSDTREPMWWRGVTLSTARRPGRAVVEFHPGDELIVAADRTEIYAEHGPSVTVEFFYRQDPLALLRAISDTPEQNRDRPSRGDSR